MPVAHGECSYLINDIISSLLSIFGLESGNIWLNKFRLTNISTVNEAPRIAQIKVFRTIYSLLANWRPNLNELRIFIFPCVATLSKEKNFPTYVPDTNTRRIQYFYLSIFFLSGRRNLGEQFGFRDAVWGIAHVTRCHQVTWATRAQGSAVPLLLSSSSQSCPPSIPKETSTIGTMFTVQYATCHLSTNPIPQMASQLHLFG